MAPEVASPPKLLRNSGVHALSAPKRSLEATQRHLREPQTDFCDGACLSGTSLRSRGFQTSEPPHSQSCLQTS
eukprot:15473937-Alexandrium_andersonii.AAC.1